MSDDNKAPGWSVREYKPTAGPRVYGVLDGRRLVCWVECEPDARRIVEAVNGVGALRADLDRVIQQRNDALSSRDTMRCERDELRALLIGSALAAADQRADAAPKIAPDTLAALNEAAARLTATIERHQVLLGIAPKRAAGDEIAKLRAVALTVADWLDDEADSPSDESAYDSWDRLGDAVAVAVLGDSDRWEETPAALRTLAGGDR